MKNRTQTIGLVLAPLLAAAGLAFAYLTVHPFGGAYLYFPLTAVLASSLYGGLGPGVVTLALSLAGYDYLLLGPPHSFGIETVREAHRLAEFALAGLAGTWICARYRSARLAAELARDEARRVGALQERLVAVVSHDLRNPLSSLHAGLDLLARLGPLEPRQRSVVARMQGSSRRMERLIEDLLGFARTRRGESFPVTLAPARLGEICAHVVSEFQETSPSPPIRLSVEGDDEGLIDAARLYQVTSNLVANAVRYGSRSEPIDVTVRGTPDDLELRVTNRGAPIPAELLPSVFEPFRSGGEGHGLGLGLFVVKEIVTAHGGTVRVRSVPEETSFEVSLPRGGSRSARLAPAPSLVGGGHAR